MSGTKLRSNSATSAPRFSAIFCHRSSSPTVYCAPTTALAAGGTRSVALNPNPKTRKMAIRLWPHEPSQHGGEWLFPAGGEVSEKGHAHRQKFQSERNVRINYPHLNTARPTSSRLFVRIKESEQICTL